MEGNVRYRVMSLIVNDGSYKSYHCLVCGNKVTEVSGSIGLISDIHDDDTDLPRTVTRCDGRWCKTWHEIRIMPEWNLPERIEVILADPNRGRYRDSHCARCGGDIGYISGETYEFGSAFLPSPAQVECDNCQAAYTFTLHPKGARIS